jgi:2-polyprenyl-3-methyl-5-hydroxy-6-metoxy-1,4-benzoquinol methylase
MDDPELDRSDHFQALRGLQRINRWTRNAGLAWRPVQELARQLGRKHLKILDIGTGSADIPIQLWRRAQDAGLDLEIEASDVSDQALQFAAQNCERAGAKLRLLPLDVLQERIEEEYDVVMCSQFLHHLSDEQAELVLDKMKAAATCRVIAVDLVRSRLNWLQVWFAARTLSRSKVVHFDGPQSIRAAFTIDEIKTIAGRIGFSEFSIKSHWPCRFVLVGDVTDG